MEVKKRWVTREAEGIRRGRRGGKNNSYKSRHRKRKMENNRSICEWRHRKEDRETKKIDKRRKR